MGELFGGALDSRLRGNDGGAGSLAARWIPAGAGMTKGGLFGGALDSRLRGNDEGVGCLAARWIPACA
ncbi:MAG TPA: hypothetical protein VFE24_01340, partial [Pirellulales bacterium]|nr:hypothetical protein [Pirellulales bacterium]